MSTTRIGNSWARAALGALLVGLPAATGSAQVAASGPFAPGAPFPPVTLENLNTDDGQPASVDLTAVLGKKPVILCYWIAGNRHSENVLVQLQSLVDEIGSDRIALYGLVLPQPGRDATIVQARIRAAAIDVPVLNDKEFKIGNRLMVKSVPCIAIIDRAGKLRLANGASLAQVLEYRMDVEAAIRRVAETGNLGTYGYLDHYFPVRELVGKPCPDFSASLLAGGDPRRWSDLMDDKKLNVLIFWSVDCSHCRKSLPEINDWLKQHPGSINVVSAASVVSPTAESKTREFCEENGFVFPTLADADHKLSEQFLVTATPTIVLIRPDGVIDSVFLSDLTDFGKAIEATKRKVF